VCRVESGKSASHICARLSLLQLIPDVALAFVEERSPPAVDLAGLERRFCEWNRAIKNHLDNYTEFVSGILA
jgi:hypothetical protein